jgi:hypothetical protein
MSRHIVSSPLLSKLVIAIAKSSFLIFPSLLVGEGQGEGLIKKELLAMSICYPNRDRQGFGESLVHISRQEGLGIRVRASYNRQIVGADGPEFEAG